MPAPGAGGVQTSLVGTVQSMMASARNAFRRKPGPTPGAPIQSPGGNPPDLTQFSETFEPSGGLFAPGYPLPPVEPERLPRSRAPVDRARPFPETRPPWRSPKLRLGGKRTEPFFIYTLQRHQLVQRGSRGFGGARCIWRRTTRPTPPSRSPEHRLFASTNSATNFQNGGFLLLSRITMRGYGQRRQV